MSSKLTYRHISHAAKKTINYIDGRRKGFITSLRTSHEKLNRTTLNGFEWNKIVTLAGMSGSGKSMILEQWKRDFVNYNPNEKFLILSFEFEMLATDQVARNISGHLEISTRKLFGAEDPLTDEDLIRIKEVADDIGKYPIFYVDNIGTVEQIEDTITGFTEEKNLKSENLGLIVTLDHTLLTRGRQGEAERQTLQALYEMCIRIKKDFDHNDMKILFILVSQLNRDIEDKERILNPKLHFPQRSDIFGASAVFYSSDYLIISHNPSILGITAYGVGDKFPNGLPVKSPVNTDKMMIYWHVLKSRGGKPTILMMEEDFAHSKVIDFVRNEE